VLPLVPIKIISLTNAAKEDRERSAMLGVFMFSGVLAFWLALGSMIAMVSGFTATNQLFQYPPFTISVGVIIAVMALGMCGLFQTRLPAFLYMIDPDQESTVGSFVMGVLTAVLSTPCTAPFMGAAAAWASTRQPAVTLATFSAIGTGMAAPYLILSVFPGMLGKLPKTGPGSVLLKEVMGLLMLAAAAYFIGGGLSAVFSHPPDPPSRLYWWSVAAPVAAAGGWVGYRTFRITDKKTARTLFAALGGLMICGAAFAGLRMTDRGPINWIYYTPERLDAALAKGKTVVMVFTAEWCLNCKALEQGVLHDRDVSALFSDGNAVPVKVDITGKNTAGKAKLREVGSLTIPLLVVLSPEGDITFKSDFYTADQIIEAVAATRAASG
jgi:thiol:disulfide interchange protein DsbD